MYRCDASRPPTLAATAVALMTVMSLMAWPDAASAQSTDDSRELRACDGYMELYARSAARKLGRALSGQGYVLETVDLAEQIETNNGGQTVSFEVYPEKKGRSVGLVDARRQVRQSFVAVGTEEGLVVTSHTWPSRAEIADGTKCRPVTSRIVHPHVAVRSVDVEPFKYWGLRISWHLPESFDVKTAGNHDALVRELIEKATAPGSQAEPVDGDEQQQKTGSSSGGDEDNDSD